jgi:hypothetical protein
MTYFLSYNFFKLYLSNNLVGKISAHFKNHPVYHLL